MINICVILIKCDTYVANIFYMSKKGKNKVIIENDCDNNAKDKKKTGVPKKTIIVNDTDIKKLTCILKKYDTDIIDTTIYREDCQTIYRLYINIEKSNPKLLNVSIKKKILTTILANITKSDELSNYDKLYFLYKNKDLIPSDIKTVMEFDENFFKYHYIFTKSILEKMCYKYHTDRHYSNKNKKIKHMRIMYIKKIIIDSSNVYPDYISTYFKNSLIFHDVYELSTNYYYMLPNYLDENCYNINLNKIFELCRICNFIELISSLMKSSKSIHKKTIHDLIHEYLKINYEKNNGKLLHITHNNCDCYLSSSLTKYFIEYTDCYSICAYIKLDVNEYVNILENSQLNKQKKNIFRSLLYKIENQVKHENKNYKKKYNTYMEHIDSRKSLYKSTFEPLCNNIMNIQKDYTEVYKVFQTVFNKIKLSIEYMKIVIQLGTPYNFIGYRFMLDMGVNPTEEILELVCRYLYCQDIYLTIERKVLPTQLCFENYIQYNPFVQKHSKYNNVDRITPSYIFNLFLENGVQLTNDIIIKCIKNHINIDFSKYDVEHTLDMHTAYTKYKCPISDGSMEQFKKFSEINNIILLRDGFSRRMWQSIAKIGLEHKIIPDQECLNLACMSSYIDVPINLLTGAKIIQYQYGSNGNDEYINFLLTKTFSLALTRDNIQNLHRNDRIKCLTYISYAFVKNHFPTNEDEKDQDSSDEDQYSEDSSDEEDE